MKKILFAACLTAMVSVGAAFAQNIDTSKPLPAEYFYYDLDASGDGMIIHHFSDKVSKEFTEKDSKGNWKRTFSVLNFPSEIEGLPVTMVDISNLGPRGKKGNDIIPWDLVIIPDGIFLHSLSIEYAHAPIIIYTKKLILGKNLKFPGSYKFYYLEEFVVPESVTELGYYGDVQFTTAVIPEHIKVIPYGGGIQGANLKDIIFHDNVGIEEGAKFDRKKLPLQTQRKIIKLTLPY